MWVSWFVILWCISSTVLFFLKSLICISFFPFLSHWSREEWATSKSLGFSMSKSINHTIIHVQSYLTILFRDGHLLIRSTTNTPNHCVGSGAVCGLCVWERVGGKHVTCRTMSNDQVFHATIVTTICAHTYTYTQGFPLVCECGTIYLHSETTSPPEQRWLKRQASSSRFPWWRKSGLRGTQNKHSNPRGTTSSSSVRQSILRERDIVLLPVRKPHPRPRFCRFGLKRYMITARERICLLTCFTLSSLQSFPSAGHKSLERVCCLPRHVAQHQHSSVTWALTWLGSQGALELPRISDLLSLCALTCSTGMWAFILWLVILCVA